MMSKWMVKSRQFSSILTAIIVLIVTASFAVSSPVNDYCTNATIATESVPYTGSTVTATGSQESSCAYNDELDVWYEYTAASTQTVIVSLCDSDFDTTLAVYDGCGGVTLACTDDFCGLQSKLEIDVTQGSTYFIRIAGYEWDVGNYTLLVTVKQCALPAEPNNPTPADDANNVSTEVTLLWNEGKIKALKNEDRKTRTSPSQGQAIPKIIYGPDDRLEQYEVTDPHILAIGDSTVALVYSSDLTDNGDGTFSMPAETFAEYYLSVIERPLCGDEPYRDQPVPAFCSGFLIDTDIIATAGHCIDPGSNLDVAFVFGFVMLDAATANITIDGSEIYYASEIIGREETATSDWGLIKLDRDVTGHVPLSIRREGTVPDNQDLLVIGHPVGLPRKYAAGASVRDNTPAEYFQANLDTYGGNSGSAVFNADTYQVEGILVRGNEDFVADGPCDRSNVCPDTGCPNWEDVTRITELLDQLPWENYDVYLDTNDPPVEMICGDTDQQICEPNDQLLPCTKYYWQVIVKNACGQTPGPILSFTTRFVDPDFDGDCDVDFKDLRQLGLYWLENQETVDLAEPNDIIDFADLAVLANVWLWSK